MLTITKVIEWDMGHRVPNHKNKCRNPHGHRYRLEVTIEGDLNQEKGTSSEGMVVDFGDIKSIILAEVHDTLDHSFMIYEEDLVLRAFFESQQENFTYLLVPFIPTAENIVRWCSQKIAAKLPANLCIANCRLYETPNSWADYKP